MRNGLKICYMYNDPDERSRYLTNDDLPVLDSLGDLIGGAHFRVGDAAHHEDDQPGHVLDFVLVPVAGVPHTARPMWVRQDALHSSLFPSPDAHFLPLCYI